MNFYSLNAVVSIIAARIQVPGWVPSDRIDSWRHAQAAGKLHQELCNSTSPPRWVELHPITQLPVFNDAVAEEGRAMLVHMAGCFERENKAEFEHHQACTQHGVDPLKEPRSVKVNDGKYLLHKFSRYFAIGFDLSKTYPVDSSTILGELASTGRQSPEGALPVTGDNPRPLQRGAALEQRVRKILRELGEDPKSLPPPQPGKPGLRKRVRTILLGEGITLARIEHAWKAVLKETKNSKKQARKA